VPEPSDLEASAPLDVYSDALKVGSNIFGFIFGFGLATDSPGESKPVVTVRMSPQHTLVLYQVLKNQLRQYQATVGPIALPDEMYTGMEIEREV
jgi:hypothetical protein